MSQTTSTVTPVPTARTRTGLGWWALVSAVVATTGSLAASIMVGATVGPMEVEYGRLLSDTPAAYETTVLVLLVSQVLWTVLGVTALVLGTVAIARRASRGAGIAAVVTAVLAPVVSFLAFLACVIVTSPLG